MNDNNLNLARKWRAKTFGQLIGQELTIRMLKNSLFLDKFFPVYLFSGQRGCGKTSTARVFAAAVNCRMLKKFQKSPKDLNIPCLKCESCIAMQKNKHPDFLEMDAASHTGVDNARQIIDSASLMPILGKKKIYLIDEAHMLSKSAFNAFLKILEEPPESVIFILATTEAEKIIETVKSRSFQLFFNSVDNNVLVKHLKNICREENIVIKEEAALDFLAKEAGGSVRDAINLLEQVRFTIDKIDLKSVLKVLGHLPSNNLIKLLEILFKGNIKVLLEYLKDINIEDYSPENIWKKLIMLLKDSIWIKSDLSPRCFYKFHSELKTILDGCALEVILLALEEFYKNELVFMKTIDKHLFLENVLLRICCNNSTSGSASKRVEKNDNIIIKKMNKWESFLSSITKLDDPLIFSIFKQAEFLKEENAAVQIEFPKQLIFLKDLLEENKNIWMPIFKSVFTECNEIKPVFNEKKIFNKKKMIESIPKKNIKKKGSSFSIANKEEWKKANYLVENFSGKIYSIEEDNNV